MTGFAHILDNANHPYISIFVIVVALSSWGIGVAAQLKAFHTRIPGTRPSPVFYKAIAVFASVIAIEFFIRFFVQWAAWEDIKPRLFAKIDDVRVDGKSFDDPRPIVYSLQHIRGVMGHHSHPTAVYRVYLRTSLGPLVLDMARNSGDANEYWVSVPSYHESYIGRAYTAVLDNYSPVSQ